MFDSFSVLPDVHRLTFVSSHILTFSCSSFTRLLCASTLFPSWCFANRGNKDFKKCALLKVFPLWFLFVHVARLVGINRCKGWVQPDIQMKLLSSHLHAWKSRNPQNISGASQQNRVAAFSSTTEVWKENRSSPDLVSSSKSPEAPRSQSDKKSCYLNPKRKWNFSRSLQLLQLFRRRLQSFSVNLQKRFVDDETPSWI